MLYLIGLGLSADGISKLGLQVVKKCKKVYLENYTVDFPYGIPELQDHLLKKVVVADRDKVESLELVDEASKKDVALLIYGSPLTATTHITLFEEAKKSGIKVKVIYGASVIDAVGETGLQIYKFGKIVSMPAWQENYEPDSFMKTVQENLSMKAHSLILSDIGLNFSVAIKQLETAAKIHKISLKKLVVCQSLGTRNSKIVYRDIEELKTYRGVNRPFCIIIPSKLHFVEKEVLKNYE